MERKDWRNYWEISLTVKELQNLSLFILPPVNVKYYCPFQSWHPLTESTRGLSLNCCSLHSDAKWLISKTKVSCSEGQMYWFCSFTWALLRKWRGDECWFSRLEASLLRNCCCETENFIFYVIFYTGTSIAADLNFKASYWIVLWLAVL